MGNVYLGVRVKDTGRKGFDNLHELAGIVNAILRDLFYGRIDCKLALKRLNFLYFLSERHLPRTSLPKAYKIINIGVATAKAFCSQTKLKTRRRRRQK